VGRVDAVAAVHLVGLQPVRTNNDCEGWHYRLNAKAKHGRLNLYQLVQLLSTEASLVSIQVRLLSEGTTTRLQRSSYNKLHTRLNKYCRTIMTTVIVPLIAY